MRAAALTPSATFDAVVIGAGPAGAMAARELARRGIDVLLVERKTLPRPKVCGACLNGRAISWLKLAGLDGLLSQLGAIPTRRFCAYCQQKMVEIELPGGAALSREALDHGLAQAAVRAGTHLLTDTTATVRGGVSPWREIELRNSSGRTEVVRAKVVLAADGLGHPALASCREFVSRISRRTKIGVQASLCDRFDRFAAGTIYMTVGEKGYAGLVRVEDGSINLAAAVAPDALKRAGSPAAAVGAIFREAGLEQTDIANLDLSSAAWQGTLPLTRRTVRPVAHRVFVLGDAAGYVEPFTGEGIAWALASGMAVADFAARGLDGWSRQVEQGWLAAYGKQVRRRQLWCRAFAALLRRPCLARAALELASAWPALCRPIVASLNRPAQSLELARL
ncbi:MAG TPA: NAD(P)/FAD-dependent oxidoreductase [Pirellulales bacterium]|nr:NAD(P)/FAD-dependent oxidoreductase [Pirellulales bacterium]